MATNIQTLPTELLSEVMSHLTCTWMMDEDEDESCLDDRSAWRLVCKLFRDGRSLHQLIVDRYGADMALLHAVWSHGTMGSEEKACREATVRGLLEMPHGVAPRADAHDSIALLSAVSGGCEGIVRLLLEATVHAAHADAHDSIALQSAVSGGHEGIVRLLLEATVHAAHADANDSTALMVAVERGHEGIVRLLLEATVHAAHADANDSRALMVAGAGGCEGIVRLLLEARTHAARAARADIDGDGGDDDAYGRLLLEHAATGGHEGIVTLLVEATPPASLGDFGDDDFFDWAKTCGGWVGGRLKARRAYEMVIKAQARAMARAMAKATAKAMARARASPPS